MFGSEGPDENRGGRKLLGNPSKVKKRASASTPSGPSSIIGKRIFGLPASTQSSRFDVREDLPDDLAKICRAQGAAAQVVAVAPAEREREMRGSRVFFRGTNCRHGLSSPGLLTLQPTCGDTRGVLLQNCQTPSLPPPQGLRPQIAPRYSLVSIVHVLFWQAGVEILLQVVPYPGTGMHLLC